MKRKRLGIAGVCLAKFMSAGITAFVFLNLLCFVYYNLPVHITARTGATDYVWEPRVFYSKMTEGFGYGRMNNEGFNNLQDYTAQPVDILLMGSSHMEGTNVPQHKTTAALLNRLSSNRYAYNIGISGHSFPRIVNNIERAVQCYNPRKYVIIETGSIQIDIPSLEKSITQRLERIPSHDSKIMFYLQKIPYLRLLYFQYKNFTGKSDADISEENSVITDEKRYAQVLSSAIRKISEIAEGRNINVIIFYHPHLTLNKDGSVSDNTDTGYLKIFEDACNTAMGKNVFFVNMSGDFIRAYENNHILPHGFLNTAVGQGHLNKNGHSMIANRLVKQFIEKG